MSSFSMRSRYAVIAILLGVRAASAQTPANDPSTRLREVLPGDVAGRVLAVIAKARSQELPAEALENRALKFAAKGVSASDIERAISEQAARMEQVRETLRSARNVKPTADEIEAGAEAVRKGVDGAKVSALAKSTPSGRSLAVPLYVIGSLVDRGLPSDSALRRVQERLTLRATDSDLDKMPGEVRPKAVGSTEKKPAETGRELGKTKQPGSATGSGEVTKTPGTPPTGVPVKGASGTTTPPGQTKKQPTKP